MIDLNNTITGDSLGEYDTEESDIHKEYNLLVFKYAQLLSNYLQLQKDYAELLDRDNQTLKELIFLKESMKKNIRFGSLPEEE